MSTPAERRWQKASRTARVADASATSARARRRQHAWAKRLLVHTTVVPCGVTRAIVAIEPAWRADCTDIGRFEWAAALRRWRRSAIPSRGPDRACGTAEGGMARSRSGCRRETRKTGPSSSTRSSGAGALPGGGGGAAPGSAVPAPLPRSEPDLATQPALVHTASSRQSMPQGRCRTRVTWPRSACKSSPVVGRHRTRTSRETDRIAEPRRIASGHIRSLRPVHRNGSIVSVEVPAESFGVTTGPPYMPDAATHQRQRQVTHSDQSLPRHPDSQSARLHFDRLHELRRHAGPLSRNIAD